MASLFKKPRSPFWWIKKRDADPNSPTFGQLVRSSTKMQIGVGRDRRAAEQMCAEATLAESKSASAAPAERWGEWVENYLRVYCKTATTLSRYSTIWKNLRMYLTEKNVTVPRQLTRAHCMDYVAWRLTPDKRSGKYKAVHNTAHLELKILSLLMGEAVRRNFCPFNPVRDLGIKRMRPKEKPELTNENLDFIWQSIQSEKPANAFLANSFLIARYQGCRLNETHLNPMTDVDLEPPIIRFRIKGGREHTAPLHPKLIPLFTELKAAKAKETFCKPPNPSRKWFDFLKRIKMRETVPGCCFHSLRVTAVTKLARSKTIPESQAMRYVGHASTSVHRAYQRLRTEDLGDCLDALT